MDIEKLRSEGICPTCYNFKYGEYIISIFIAGFDEMHLYYNNEATTLGSKIHNAVFNNFIENKGKIKIK